MAVKKKVSGRFKTLCRLGVELAGATKADALLFMLDGPIDWELLQAMTGESLVLVAADQEETLAGAAEAGLRVIVLDMPTSPVSEKLTQALLEAVADDFLAPGAQVVALYAGFDVGAIDSMSVIRLDEHLGRLTVRDLRQLETRVPLDTLKTVVDLAVDIGREGREGKPVGALFIVGDHRKVLKHCHPISFDPVRGYNRSERKLTENRVREVVKEIAQLDGAFIVAADATIEAAAQYISAPAASITLSKGLGARHWAAAAISRSTKAVAVSVSESNGTVRLFHNGEVVLRIEPFRRAMKWKDFEVDPPAGGE